MTNVEIMLNSREMKIIYKLKMFLRIVFLGRKWVTPNNKQCICRDTLIYKCHFRLRVFIVNKTQKRLVQDRS